jgi:spermidine synthase
MTKEWLAYLKQLLSEIDLPRLLNSLLERSQELPPQIASDLKQLAKKLYRGEPLSNLPPKTAEFVMMLSVTLLMANLVMPDAVFGKGGCSSESSEYSSGNSNCSSGESIYASDVNWLSKLWGLGFTTAGVMWLINIFTRSRDE